MNREREIVKASIYGIIGNALLVAFKMAVGFMSHSIAIILDGVNNATDALSSIVTIVGTKLAGRRPDRHHPFGYGRVEYLTSVVIAIIILVAGFISLRESIDKIIHPGTPSYSAITITVIVVAILAKIAIGIMFKRFGDKTNSEALIASGIDSNYDAVLSAGTLVVAAAQNFWNLNIDGAVGLIISLVVLKAGFEVRGTYDVVLDNFGPNEILGSVHIEVPDDMCARDIHALTRQTSEGLAEKFGILATVGIYAANTTGAFAPLHADLDALAKSDPAILQMHGFYVDEKTSTIYFDLVIGFKADDDAIRDKIIAHLKEKYPDYTYNVVIDHDYEDDQPT